MGYCIWAIKSINSLGRNWSPKIRTLTTYVSKSFPLWFIEELKANKNYVEDLLCLVPRGISMAMHLLWIYYIIYMHTNLIEKEWFFNVIFSSVNMVLLFILIKTFPLLFLNFFRYLRSKDRRAKVGWKLERAKGWRSLVRWWLGLSWPGFLPQFLNPLGKILNFFRLYCLLDQICGFHTATDILRTFDSNFTFKRHFFDC